MSLSQETSIDIGELKRLKVLCISETGWFDTETLLADIQAAGGLQANQYDYGWPPFGELHPDNAGGSSALIEVEELDGTIHKFLLDSGWGQAWMAQRFVEEGIDKMLQQGEIECLILSHEHFDHFWGIQTTLKHCPEITIYLHHDFYQEGLDFLKQAGHTGELVVLKPQEPLILWPGLALVNFSLPIICRIHGESVIYCQVKDKGLCMVTGCGHPGVTNLLDYARQTFQGGTNLYGVYGGLHISPFEDWDAEREALVQSLKEYNIQQWGCNHCTGYITAEKMIEAGLPVVRGTARHGSKRDLYLGNGDTIEF